MKTKTTWFNQNVIIDNQNPIFICIYICNILQSALWQASSAVTYTEIVARNNHLHALSAGHYNVYKFWECKL